MGKDTKDILEAVNFIKDHTVEMCPARGVLRVVGYELAAGRDVPDQVTLPCQASLDETALGADDE